MELIGIIFPPVIDLINRFVKDSAVRFLIAFIICAATGVFLNWIETGFVYADRLTTFQSISASILAVYGSSQISYQFYKDSGVQKAIDPRVGAKGGSR
ncbi:MAG: hypothetical protein [Podoviridae sp. ctg2L5]|nr:MAG: hypothetical protein [Podoviridae sp. ctg2L5]